VSKAIFLFANVAFIIGFALIANELGFATQTVDIPVGFVAPESGSFLDKIIAPFVWAFQAAGAFFQLTTIVYFGIHPIVFALVFGPLIFVDAFLIYGMVRGGGT